MTSTYARRKAAGLCPWCEVPVADGHVYCPACRHSMRLLRPGWERRVTEAQAARPPGAARPSVPVEPHPATRWWWRTAPATPIREGDDDSVAD